MIQIKNLTKIYPNGFKALDDVSLYIGREEFVYLVGMSGAGKSTQFLASSWPACR